MPVPTVMRWDHKNAPQIIDMHDWTQIKAWYQAIFVDGYLADDDTTPIPGLGWDVAFDDGAFTVTVTMVGDPNLVNLSRLFLQYKNFINSSLYGLKGYFNEHLDSGTKIAQFGVSNEDTNGGIYGIPLFTGINDGGIDKICPYVVIGTGRSIFFLGGYNPDRVSPEVPPFSSTLSYSTYHYFGDFINDGPDYGKNNQCATDTYSADQGNTTYYDYNKIDTLANWYLTQYKNRVYCQDNNNSYNGIHVARDYQGIPRGFNFSATPIGYGGGNSYLGAYVNMAVSYPYPDGSLKLIPHDLWTRNNLETIVSGERNITYIGKMPGWYIPLHYLPFAAGSQENLVEFEGTGAYEGQQFIGLARYPGGEFYINISENWAI